MELYKVGEVLGKGGFGVVYAGTRFVEGKEVAIKHVARGKVVEWASLGGRRVPLELKLLHAVQAVKGVLRLFDFFERNDSFIYVMERPSDCKDLFDYITEGQSRKFFFQITSSIVACHKRGVVHRDIKDENILIDWNTLEIKLIDFGSGTFLSCSNC